MKVLVLGGTGNIGSAVVQALVKRGARVTILCRNGRRAEKAEALGSSPLVGDIKAPERWVSSARAFDAVIHAACTFDAEMAATDTNLTGALIEALSESRSKKKLIYTGGAWCYGNTPSGADESSPFDPTPEFAWGVANSRWVLRAASISGVVVHPANVVDKSVLGIPPILLRENEGQRTLRVPGTPVTHWPLVERDDLAQLYCLALERGRAGEDYIGASEEGVGVGKLAGLLARQWNLSGETTYESAIYWMQKYGSWARGYALNQVMRSHKASRELGWAPAFKISA